MNRTVSFEKYQGCGNHFILIENLQRFFSYDSSLIQKLCHPHFGIGADGVILLEPSNRADFSMRIFNSDGGEAEMCGNGLRCFGLFLKKLGNPKNIFTIETKERILSIQMEDGLVNVSMGLPVDLQWDIPLALNGNNIRIHSLNTGVPHAVQFVNTLEDSHFVNKGKEIRFHPFFAPKGTNFNQVQLKEKGVIKIRTYERGVEAETLACGTGATAAALATAAIYHWPSPIQVELPSKESMQISFDYDQKTFREVYMKGPAKHVFSGSFLLDNFC